MRPRRRQARRSPATAENEVTMAGSGPLEEALERFPRVTLAHAPTPLEPMPNLGAALGAAALWVKRDDCTGLAFGGNKARQLEYYFGAAEAAEVDTVLITGAVQSNYVRMAVAAARKLAMDCHIQLEDRVPHGRSALPGLRQRPARPAAGRHADALSRRRGRGRCRRRAAPHRRAAAPGGPAALYHSPRPRFQAARCPRLCPRRHRARPADRRAKTRGG